jgi:GTP-binding protein EngB required for normal cell division
VKILVLGRTGSGKSTLINNILGRKIAPVGHRLYPETRTVSAYKKEIYGVSVTVCDTPGLGDASGNEEEYMKNIKAYCGNPDLVIYCQSMDNTRWHADDENAIKIVTKHLGKEIWNYSMLVLTFADKFVANLPENETDDIFKQRRSDSEQMFKGTLKKIGVRLTGSDKIFSAVSAKGRKHLPGVQNWMTYLMITCLTMTRVDGIEGFHQIVIGRLTNPHPEDEERLTWTDTLCKFMQR